MRHCLTPAAPVLGMPARERQPASGSMTSRMLAPLALMVIAASLLAFGGWSRPVVAHPHVWIDAVATFLFAERKLVGLRHRWEFDEFFGSFVIEEHDIDRDGAFDAAETEALRAAAFANLREFGYFT